MKIYIDKFNLDILNQVSDLYKEYLVNAKEFIMLYTNEGIYNIEDKQTYFLSVNDKPIKLFEKYYNNLTLIVDESYFNKQNVTSVVGNEHVSFHIKEYSYKMNKKSTLTLVIKYKYINEKANPEDIYFEINKDIDINDPFMKKEIIEFLSLLN